MIELTSSLSSNIETLKSNDIQNNINCWFRIKDFSLSKQNEKSKVSGLKLPLFSIDLFYTNNFISKMKIFEFNNSNISIDTSMYF